MTNQVNQYERHMAIQEAYQIHDSDEYFKARPQLECGDRRKVFYAGHIRGYQAATQASEIEINSLKERVEELESWKNQAIAVESEWDCQSVGKALNIPLGHSIRENILPKIAELTASNNQLREAVQALVDRWNTPKWKDAEHTAKFIHALEKALSSTSTQSLAKHDNDVIERIATALENAEGEFKTLPEYVALVRAMKND